MAENFYTMLTIVGKNKLSSSAVSGSKVNFKNLKVGDGKGAYYEPSENQTSLVNKVWEGNISSISIDENNSNWIVVETVIPASDGGFFIREAGIFDEDGDMIAISKLAETYKPVVAEGSTKDLVIRIVLEVLNVDTVTIKIDPNVVAATKNDVQVLEAKFEDVSAQLSENTQNIAQLSNQNLLINGDFTKTVNQRGQSSYTTNYAYAIDRWNFVNWENSSNAAKGTLKVNNGDSIEITGAGADQLYVQQPLEDLDTKSLLGKTVTLSCLVKSKNLTQGSFFVQATDWGTSNTIKNIILNYSDIPTDSYKKITMTFVVPTSISKLAIQIGSFKSIGNGMINNTGSILLQVVKLELGSIATPFVPRLYAEELALCQRYYENNFIVGGHGVVDPNGNVSMYIPYKVAKRISPTVTVNSSLLSNCLSQVGYTPKTPTSITLSDRDINGNFIFFGGLTGAVGYNITIADNSALKSLITADAEIY